MFKLNQLYRKNMETPTMKQSLLLASTCLILVMSLPVTAGDIDAGKKKSATCAACHGAEGISINPVWPNLAGQGEDYLISQLHSFKNGDRANAQMSPMATNLSDDDINDLAAFFSSRKAGVGQTKPENIAPGARVYRAGNNDTGVPACMACHGPDGKGNPAALYPSLSGQHAAYTEAQLNAYRTGQRTNSVMQTIANKMSDDEIKAVSDFVQGLH